MSSQTMVMISSSMCWPTVSSRATRGNLVSITIHLICDSDNPKCCARLQQPASVFAGGYYGIRPNNEIEIGGNDADRAFGRRYSRSAVAPDFSERPGQIRRGYSCRTGNTTRHSHWRWRYGGTGNESVAPESHQLPDWPTD